MKFQYMICLLACCGFSNVHAAMSASASHPTRPPKTLAELRILRSQDFADLDGTMSASESNLKFKDIAALDDCKNIRTIVDELEACRKSYITTGSNNSESRIAPDRSEAALLYLENKKKFEKGLAEEKERKLQAERELFLGKSA